LLHLAGETSVTPPPIPVGLRVGQTIDVDFVVYLLAHSCSTLCVALFLSAAYCRAWQTWKGGCMYSYVVETTYAVVPSNQDGLTCGDQTRCPKFFLWSFIIVWRKSMDTLLKHVLLNGIPLLLAIRFQQKLEKFPCHCSQKASLVVQQFGCTHDKGIKSTSSHPTGFIKQIELQRCGLFHFDSCSFCLFFWIKLCSVCLHAHAFDQCARTRRQR
jgi:hypothetical protein